MRRCLWTFALQLFNGVCGLISSRSRSERRDLMGRWRKQLGGLLPAVPWRERALRILLRLRYRAIAWFGKTAASAAIGGVWSGRRHCSRWNCGECRFGLSGFGQVDPTEKVLGLKIEIRGIVAACPIV